MRLVILSQWRERRTGTMQSAGSHLTA